ncbi:MAG TPA: Na(+)/H(+) antiporter subunit C [Jiangellaceae bacterium]
MNTNVTLTLVVAVLVGTGVYLLLERALTRVVLGIVLIGNAANVLLILASGPAGGPPLVGVTEPDRMSDPLPQALILTAIVIAFGSIAFVLAMAYRSWQVNRSDDVKDDFEDALVRRRARLDESANTDLDERDRQ